MFLRGGHDAAADGGLPTPMDCDHAWRRDFLSWVTLDPAELLEHLPCGDDPRRSEGLQG
jgi:hypothetical protein